MKNILPEYDVIVVGGGHAGCEAAAAAANLGATTLLITMDMMRFAQMSCNPAMGGIAKGQIVREIDALGGYSAIVTDRSTIQFRMLNQSKGPAMWSPRAQCDRALFSAEWRNVLEKIPNLDFWQDTVDGLIIENDTVVGVKTALDVEIKSKTVILTAGTFLNGLMHIGQTKLEGGRIAEMPSLMLSEQIEKMGIQRGRMKTGTPARIDARSVDFSKLVEQFGDNKPSKFSFLPETKPVEKQMSCFIVYTNEISHDVIRADLANSPMYDGTIKSIGPRYCPSIESKIVTFSDKEKHLLFLEPEGYTTHEMYLNGFSSSLPIETQLSALKKLHGFENVKFFRPGYAIEYDYFDPTQLNATMETKLIPNLYLAGQVNGTTGYEEAAAQGLIAGINAALKIQNKEPFVLKRDEAYIGVLIDDLITKGVDEPYRMFTSRAEYRVLLRQDNADLRLTEKSHRIGLASSERMDYLSKKRNSIAELVRFINEFTIKPQYINSVLEKLGTPGLSQSMKLVNVLLRPQVSIFDLIDPIIPLQDLINKLELSTDEVLTCAEIEVKYSGYIEREKMIAEKLSRLENVAIKDDFDYNRLLSLSTEARQKLTRIKPKNIGQAARISGVSPSDINVILVSLGR